MSYEKVTGKNIIIGTKQTVKALKLVMSEVVVADDADQRVTAKVSTNSK